MMDVFTVYIFTLHSFQLQLVYTVSYQLYSPVLCLPNNQTKLFQPSISILRNLLPTVGLIVGDPSLELPAALRVDSPKCVFYRRLSL